MSPANVGSDDEPRFVLLAECDAEGGVDCGWKMQHPDPDADVHDWWISSTDWRTLEAAHSEHRAERDA